MDSLSPMPEKAQSILNLQLPCTCCELQPFIKLISYCNKDMWPYHMHVLLPLTDLTNTTKYHWGPEKQEVLAKWKHLSAEKFCYAFPTSQSHSTLIPVLQITDLGAALFNE